MGFNAAITLTNGFQHGVEACHQGADFVRSCGFHPLGEVALFTNCCDRLGQIGQRLGQRALNAPRNP